MLIAFFHDIPEDGKMLIPVDEQGLMCLSGQSINWLNKEDFESVEVMFNSIQDYVSRFDDGEFKNTFQNLDLEKFKANQKLWLSKVALFNIHLFFQSIQPDLQESDIQMILANIDALGKKTTIMNLGNQTEYLEGMLADFVEIADSLKDIDIILNQRKWKEREEFDLAPKLRTKKAQLKFETYLPRLRKRYPNLATLLPVSFQDFAFDAKILWHPEINEVRQDVAMKIARILKPTTWDFTENLLDDLVAFLQRQYPDLSQYRQNKLKDYLIFNYFNESVLSHELVEDAKMGGKNLNDQGEKIPENDILNILMENTHKGLDANLMEAVLKFRQDRVVEIIKEIESFVV